MSEVKISVIIPIHNVGEYVKECVESVLNQTMREVEAICVDDASTDDSLSIINQLADKDDRVRVISYKENKSASQARKDGVMAARGEYILFLDGDDSIKENACERLYELAGRYQVDILHFGTEVINHGNAQEQRIANLYKLLKPYGKKVIGKDVFKACFVEKKFRFTLWNKLYTASLCKEAFSHVKDGNYPKAQDLYAFFVLCYYAKSYYGIEECFYNYRFGAGITGRQQISLSQMERFCTSEWTARAVQEFAASVGEEDVMDVSRQIRYDLLNDCISNWNNFLPTKLQREGFDLLAKYWRPDELSGKLCEKFFGQHHKLADRIYGAESLKLKPKETKTIGLFYYRYSVGGVQRVISLMIPMLISMGYKVAFFVEETADVEYELPEGVEKVLLPPSFMILKGDYITRAVALQEALEKYSVDLMIYHAASSTKLLFETIIMKLLNIPMILVVHEVAFQGMLKVNRELANRPSVFRLIDKVAVLSSVEELYWQTVGVDAHYVPNPIENKIVERREEDVEPHTIVWIGRLDFNTKQCMDAVEAMGRVVAEVPDARLLMVGNEVTEDATKKLKNKIKKLKLQKNVILCGETTDVNSYYQKAGIHLVTSVSETFPMTIVESKSFGIPLVMYELPFLEIVRNKKGFIAVPQGDKKQLAEALIAFLNDDSLRRTMGQEAKESLQEFLSFDLQTEWKNLIDYVTEDKRMPEKQNEQYRLLLESMLHHYSVGSRRNDKKIEEYEKKLQSKDYRFGHFVMQYPKKIYYKLKKVLHRKK